MKAKSRSEFGYLKLLRVGPVIGFLLVAGCTSRGEPVTRPAKTKAPVKVSAEGAPVALEAPKLTKQERARRKAENDREVRDVLERCNAFARTSPPQERGAVAAQCIAEEEARLGRPIGAKYDEPRNLAVKVSWEDAFKWWPHSSLLRSVRAPRKGAVFSLYVHSQSGGLIGDPTAERSSVASAFEFPPATMGSGARDVLEKGGFIVEVTYHPDPQQMLKGESRQTFGSAVVRGNVAKVREARTDDSETDLSKGITKGNVNRRWIFWDVPLQKGILRWEITNDPTIYTLKETVEFANQMQEVKR